MVESNGKEPERIFECRKGKRAFGGSDRITSSWMIDGTGNWD